MRGTKGQTVPLLFCDRFSGLGQRMGEICLDLEWITHTIKFLSDKKKKKKPTNPKRNFPRQEDSQMESNYFSLPTSKFEMRKRMMEKSKF